ncbi:MAG: rps1, partial [Gemmataceae bacterium]|nr:rps1 [Gemmataceae bacterium]
PGGRGPRPGGPGETVPPGQGGAPPPRPQQQTPPPPPRKPKPPKPLPNLTTDKKTGKAALNTFAELAAFFKTKDEPEKKDEPKPAAPPAEPKPEQPGTELPPQP